MPTADPLAAARKFVRENPQTAEDTGVDVAMDYATRCRKQHAELVNALRDVMEDANEAYQMLTDGQYGPEPTTGAWKRAKRLLAKLSK